MLNTNSQYLLPELMDIIRLFDAEERQITHYFSYEADKFLNVIEIDDIFYDFEDECKIEDDLEYKRYAKRFAKLAMYKVLSKIYNYQMPWGALTGIRPTKLAYMELEENRDFVELFEKMGVSESNIELTKKVLQGQAKIYANKGGTNLFIGIPFCPTKCEYCSFITAPIAATRKYLEDYISCLEREIDSIAPLCKNLKSVYIGGGTPFVLDIDHLERIYARLNAILPKGIEYTVEAGRPDVFTNEKLALSKKYGVNRICVNAQSFNDKTLKDIGRKHSAEDVERAYYMAREYGFIINCDLIVGLSDEGLDEVRYSINKAIDLGFDNITVHTLSLKAGAKLKENTSKLHIDGIESMLALTREMLAMAGYIPYYMYRQKYQAGGGENVGWCKEGTQCIYNVDVMEEIAHNLAVGSNAISKRVYLEENRLERFATPKDIPTYISKIDKLIEDRLIFFKDL